MKPEQKKDNNQYYAPLTYLAMIGVASTFSTVWYLTYFCAVYPRESVLFPIILNYPKVAIFIFPILIGIVSTRVKPFQNLLPNNGTVLEKCNPISSGIAIGLIGVITSSMMNATLLSNISNIVILLILAIILILGFYLLNSYCVKKTKDLK
jgi:hypothetical protein